MRDVIASRKLISVAEASRQLKLLGINLVAGQSASCAIVNKTVCPLQEGGSVTSARTCGWDYPFFSSLSSRSLAIVLSRSIALALH